MDASNLLNLLSDKPKSSKALQFELGLKSSSQIRKMVSELRNQGYPVCSNTQAGGYWLGDDTDVRRTIRDLESRIRDMSVTVNAMKSKIPLEGQISMEDDDNER